MVSDGGGAEQEHDDEMSRKRKGHLQAGYDGRGVLNELVEIVALGALVELFEHERLQLSQLVRDVHV